MRIVTLAVLSSLMLGGCANFVNRPQNAPASTAAGAQEVQLNAAQKVFWFFSPYRISIQQGNFISQEMAEKIKEGMTRDQVSFVLGTPLLTDPFHADRWDYPFRLKRGNGEILSSRVTVHFKDGFVSKFESGELPTEKEYIARIADSSVAPLREISPDAPKNPPKK
ncbi:MAG TPA: outer membrane protein assembly factor BamE [Burkholderiaceae bacterium]